MPSLLKRALSALALLAILVSTGWQLGIWGLLGFGCIICLIGILEFSTMHFSSPDTPKAFPLWFVLISSVQLIALAYFGFEYYYLVAICIPVFLAGGLWIFHQHSNNEQLYSLLVRGAFGLFYVGSLPAFGLRLLIKQEQGIFWFAFLLLVVFAGDTFAYFGGRLIKGPKLLPAISPNKTIAGAVSGLFGSIIAAIILRELYLTSSSLLLVILVSLLIAVVGQSGDLFESLMKRVAQVKDSGRFMPGHGGVLDRIDSVIMAAPIVYAASYVL